VITVLGMWEAGWFENARTERRLWKQTIQAFGVDAWEMCGVRGGPFTSPVQHESPRAMLDAHPGRKTFLVPPGRVPGSVSLADYHHPRDAVYVFGCAGDTLAGYVADGDHAVSIVTPRDTDLFAPAALAAVLYDRTVKR